MEISGSRPQAIFFDAVGTLFGIQGSVGQIYGDFAAQVGVVVDPQALNQAFFQSFASAPKLNTPANSPDHLVVLERAWWEEIAANSFAKLGVLEQFGDFSAFFPTLFDHFALADPWYVYEETLPTLSQLHQAGIRLGVLSNFDSRLYPVLKALNLADFFDSVTISTHTGYAKPDPEIFQLALSTHQLAPNQAWHVGDSWSEDVLGAAAAGLGAIWLNRDKGSIPDLGIALRVITALSELTEP